MRFRFCFFLTILFFSCSHSVPNLIKTNPIVILEYENENGFPKSRLSVFAEIDIDARKSSSIKVEYLENKYIWKTQDVCIFKSDNKQFAGVTSLSFPEGKNVQNGKYKFVFEDGSGEIVETFFSVSVPILFFDKNLEDAKNYLEDYSEKIAIYSKEKSILYYNEKKAEWKTERDFWKSFPSADSYRKCFISKNGSVMCLFPFVKKEQNSEL